MNLDKLHQQLIAAARANPPSDGVPYAFEKRIMARIKAQPEPDSWLLWSRALWRAAAPCVALSLLCVAWTFFSPDIASSDDALSADIESTVLAQFDNPSETW